MRCWRCDLGEVDVRKLGKKCGEERRVTHSSLSRKREEDAEVIQLIKFV